MNTQITVLIYILTLSTSKKLRHAEWRNIHTHELWAQDQVRKS